MWLDVTLGGIILIAAFRGWFQGFVNQALRLAEVVACVYLAQPVRDYAKPHVLPYFKAIPADFVDRALWWISGVVCYVVLVAVASLIIKITRRPEIPGIAQSSRNDQFAGFMLGAIKGVLVAAFVTAGIQRFAMDQVKTVSWADDQVKGSLAFKWSEAYRPVPKIWASRPVQHLVNHIKRLGLQKPGETSQSPPDEAEGEEPAVRTASRQADAGTGEPPSSSAASPSAPEAVSPPLSADDQAIAALKAELKKQPRSLK